MTKSFIPTASLGGNFHNNVEERLIQNKKPKKTCHFADVHGGFGGFGEESKHVAGPFNNRNLADSSQNHSLINNELSKDQISIPNADSFHTHKDQIFASSPLPDKEKIKSALTPSLPKVKMNDHTISPVFPTKNGNDNNLAKQMFERNMAKNKMEERNDVFKDF